MIITKTIEYNILFILPILFGETQRKKSAISSHETTRTNNLFSRPAFKNKSTNLPKLRKKQSRFHSHRHNRAKKRNEESSTGIRVSIEFRLAGRLENKNTQPPLYTWVSVRMTWPAAYGAQYEDFSSSVVFLRSSPPRFPSSVYYRAPNFSVSRSNLFSSSSPSWPSRDALCAS